MKRYINGVKYERIGVVAINAIKEQQAQIDALKDEIATLKSLLWIKNADAALCKK